MANSEKTRYTDTELAEFKELIETKIDSARKELKYLQNQINRSSETSIGDNFKFSGVEDGAASQEKEYLNQMAARQMKFIDHLEKALERIANKTYGICRDTGKLISKERLKAVPHATLSIDAKNAQDKK